MEEDWVYYPELMADELMHCYREEGPEEGDFTAIAIITSWRKSGFRGHELTESDWEGLVRELATRAVWPKAES